MIALGPSDASSFKFKFRQNKIKHAGKKTCVPICGIYVGECAAKMEGNNKEVTEEKWKKIFWSIYF